VQNLLDIALLKAVANYIGVVSITQKNFNIVVTFTATPKVAPDKIAGVMTKYKNLFFTVQAVSYLTYCCGEDVVHDHVLQLREILEEVAL